MLKKFLIILFWVSFFFGIGFSANISSCQTLNSAGTYTLTQNLSSPGATCFTISTGSVNLDCQGHTVTGTHSGYGIDVQTASSVTIQNCNIVDFSWGIYFGQSSASGSTLRNLNLSSNTGVGLWIQGNNHNLYEIRSNNNGQEGFNFRADSSNLENITSYSNADGLYMYNTDSNTLRNLNIYSNSNHGITLRSYASSANSNVFTNVNVTGNNRGLYLDGPNWNSNDEIQYNKFINLRATGNQYGVYLEGGSSAEVRYNNFSQLVSEGNSQYELYFTNTLGPNYIHDYNFTGERVYANSNQNEYNVIWNPNITSCFTLGWYGFSYDLRADITNHAGDCMTMPVGSVSLNCHGNMIDGTDSANGIYVSSGSGHIIQNCNFNDFSTGVYLQANSGTINNVNSSSNLQYGFYVRGNSNEISNIRANNNGVSGVNLEGDSNIFENVTSYSNSDHGIYMEDSDSNTLTNLNLYSNSDYGLYIRAYGTSMTSNGNTIRHITSTGNNRGIYMLASSWDGSEQVDWNTIRYGNITNNVYGIYLQEQGNSVEGNHFYDLNVSGNTNYNIYITNSGVFSNKFYGNVLGTSSKIYDNDWTTGTNSFSHNSIGNLWTDLTCLSSETRTLGGLDYDVCLNPSNYTVNVANNVYDTAPLENLGTSPSVTPTFINPTPNNNTIIGDKTWLIINISANYNISSCTLTWNSNSESMTVPTNDTCYINKSGITDGTYYYNVTVSSSESGIGDGTSDTRRVTFSSGFVASFSYVEPTPPKVYRKLNLTSITINVTDGGTAVDNCFVTIDGDNYSMNYNNGHCSYTYSFNLTSSFTFEAFMNESGSLTSVGEREVYSYANKVNSFNASGFSLISFLISLCIVFGSFLVPKRKLNKKGIGPVIAVTLLLAVGVASVVTFQSWFSNYNSELENKVENKNSVDKNLQVTFLEKTTDGTSLFIKNPSISYTIINQIKIGGNQCNLSGSDILGPQIVTKIDLGGCNVTQKESVEVIIITDSGISQTKHIVR